MQVCRGRAALLGHARYGRQRGRMRVVSAASARAVMGGELIEWAASIMRNGGRGEA